MKLASLFDGSGGFPLAGMLVGIEPVWASEIEPFPIRVTTKRFPNMKHYGDVSKIDGAKVEPVDIITFGSPCQDLSIAGKRAGLEDGLRSNLFYQAVRIIKEMRKETNSKYPRYAVWENVPGAYSSNNGDDFRSVLETLARVNDGTVSIPKSVWGGQGLVLGDGFSICWRTLDAQYWGVPQRRKRIFLVADFDGWRAEEILFKSEGLSRYSAEGFRTWQRLANGSKGCAGEPSGTGNGRNGVVEDGIATFCIDQGASKSTCSVSEDCATTLACTHDGAPAVCVGEESPIRKTVALEGNGTRPSHIGDGYAESDVSYTLNATEVHGVAYEEKPVFAMTTGSFPNVAEEKAPPVLARDFKDATVVTEPSFGIGRDAFNQGANAQFKPCIEEEVQPTIVAKGPGAVASPVGFYPQMKAECMTPTVEKATTLVNGTNPGFQNGVMENGYTVRRLTPTECARLQGFPDDWCSDLGTPEPSMKDIAFWYDVWETHRRIIGASEKPKSLKQIKKWLTDPYSDAAEYKMWGNGVALPCVTFVLAGIEWADRTNQEGKAPVYDRQLSIFDF